MKKGQKVKVLRGKYAGGTGSIDEKNDDYPGFYWVWVDVWVSSMRGLTFFSKHTVVHVLLSGGQLEAA